MKTVEELKNLKNYGYSFFEQFTTTEIIAILIDKINEVIRGYDNFVQVPHIKGNWSQNENYLKFDLVNYNGETYICKRSCFAPTDIKDVYYFEKLSYDIELLKEALDHYKNVEEWDKIFTETSGKIEEKYTIRLNKIDSQMEDIANNTKSKTLINALSPVDNLQGLIDDGVSDNRSIIQNLIDYAFENGYKGVYIPKTRFNVMINVNNTGINDHMNQGIILKDNICFKMHNEVTLKAIPTDKTFHVMLNIYDCKNVTVEGGTLVGERNSHQNLPNEFGYGCYVWGSENVTIRNVTSKDWWGDGFTTRDIDTKSSNNYLQPCKNIVFDNVFSDNNCRQGLSLISGKGVKVLNSTFSNTNGISPQSGIDIEPNYIDDLKKVENVVIENCHFYGNAYASIIKQRCRNVTINSCVFDDNILYIVEDCENDIIKNCTFNKKGIYRVNNTTIKNNKFNECSFGIEIENKTQVLSLIDNNMFSKCVRAVQSSPNISVTNYGKIIFQNNTVEKSSSNAFYMVGFIGNLIIKNNTFIENKGQNLFRANKGVFDGNQFIDNEISLFLYGSGNVINNNIFKTDSLNSTNFITITSANEDTIIKDNFFEWFSVNTPSMIPISITANVNRTKKIGIVNNISNNEITQFVSPPEGVVSVGNIVIPI